MRVVRVPEPGGSRIEAGSVVRGSVELTLRPEGEGDAAERVARALAATWLPDEPGRYRVEASDPLLAGLGLSVEVQVAWPDDEMRHPETDHELLARLSEQTEGRVQLSDESVRASAIGIETAGPVKLRTVLDLPGEIVLNADRLAHW